MGRATRGDFLSLFFGCEVSKEKGQRTRREATHNAGTTDARVDNGNNVSQFSLKGRIEICAALDGTEAVTVCQFGKYANVATIFELDACNDLLVNAASRAGPRRYIRVAMMKGVSAVPASKMDAATEKVD